MRDRLQLFLEACDPASPAAGDETRCAYFVDRKDGFRVEFGVRLRQRGARVLCVGQAGIGKTTEVLRSAQELSSEFTVVVPPVDRMLDLALLGWHDLAMFSCLYAAAQTNATSSESVLRLAEIAAGETYERNALIQALEDMKGLHLSVTKGQIPEPTPLQRFRNEHAAIKERIAKGPAQVADLCRQATAEIENRTSKPLMVIWDGTEKITMKAAEQLLHREGRFVMELPFRAAIVAPHGILHQDYTAEIGDFFSGEPLILRAISCQSNEPEGREFFREIVRVRQGASLIEADALDLAIDASGGNPRQLLTIVSNAARLAVVEQESVMTLDLMIRGRERAMERFYYVLKDADYRTLAQFREDRSPGPHLARLLRLLALIEYGKVGSLPKLGINPLCAPLLRRYEARATEEAS